MSISGLRRKRRNREGTARLKEVTKLIDELHADLAASKEETSQSINESMHMINKLCANMATSKEETNQRINELRADFVTSKEEMKQLINQLHADMVSKDEIKQMIDEPIHTYLSQKESTDTWIWSIRKIFALSYLSGLRELVDVNLNWIVKIVWFLILFINLLLLAYGMRPIVKDYLEEVTITKVRQIETNSAELNQPSICFLLLHDFLNLGTINDSNNDLHPIDNQSLLYLGYIKAMMPLFASSGLWLSHTTSESLTWSQFKSLPARSSYSISYEKASLFSQNALYDLLYYWGIGETNLTTSEQSKFHYNKKFYSEILTTKTQYFVGSSEGESSICLPINLSELNRVAINGQQEQRFIYQHYATTKRSNLFLVHKFTLKAHHFSSKAYSIKSPYPNSHLESQYRYKKENNRYIVVPTKYIHLNLTRQPCYDALGEIYPRGFGEFICFQDCLWNNHAVLFNCSFWEDVNPDKEQSINICHVFDIFHQLRSNMSRMCIKDQSQLWCNEKIIRSVEEWSELLMQTYRELVTEKASVIGDCKSNCANFTFCEEWELQYESLNKYDEVEFINDTIDPNSNAGLIAYRLYTLHPFVSVNEDVLKSSRAEFTSSLGGLIGFYFGASVCGYLHLLLFLFISCSRKITKMVNKLHSGGRRSTEA